MDSPHFPSATRAAHVLHLAPPDPARLARLAVPGAQPPGTARVLYTLVLTDDADTAAATAAAAGVDEAAGVARIVALTSPERAERVLRERVPAAAAVPLAVARSLIGRSALPLAGIRSVIVAAPADPDEATGRDALDAVMGELPREATRTLVAARETPAVRALVERHFFRARRVNPGGSVADAPQAAADVHVVTSTHAARCNVLRRLLDEWNPASAAIVVGDDATDAAVTRLLATLGYSPNAGVRTVRDAVPPGTVLAVFLSVPDASVLAQARAAAPLRLVVVCAPREVASLKAVAGHGAVRPLLLGDLRARAEASEVATRARLREILASGTYMRELLTLTPLLDEYEPAEVAAAALVHASEIQRASRLQSADAATAPASQERNRASTPGRRGSSSGSFAGRGGGARKPPRPGGGSHDRRRD